MTEKIVNSEKRNALCGSTKRTVRGILFCYQIDNKVFTDYKADKIRLARVSGLSNNIAYAILLMVKEGVLQWKLEI